MDAAVLCSLASAETPASGHASALPMLRNAGVTLDLLRHKCAAVREQRRQRRNRGEAKHN